MSVSSSGSRRSVCSYRTAAVKLEESKATQEQDEYAQRALRLERRQQAEFRRARELITAEVATNLSCSGSLSQLTKENFSLHNSQLESLSRSAKHNSADVPVVEKWRNLETRDSMKRPSTVLPPVVGDRESAANLS